MIGTKKVKYKGKVYKYPRNYREEYGERSPRQKKNRIIRRRARAKMVKKYGRKSVAGKDIDHIRGISRGNSFKNLRILSKRLNRSYK